jgi:glycosyltransferase involved in cell wall biosynthesis
MMERVYHVLSKHKIGSIDWARRNIGKTKTFDISLLSLVPYTENNNRLKALLTRSDIIYTKNEFQELLFLYLFLGKKQFSNKVVIGVHTTIFVPDHIDGIWKHIHNFQYGSLLYRHFMQTCKLIHIITKGYKEKISTAYKVNKDKIIFIPYFIDWTPTYKHESGKEISILWAGRYTKQKGIERLGRILSRLSNKAEYSKAKFLFAGTGEEENLINSLATKHKNAINVGFVHKMSTLYKKTDISIVTSHFETFGYNVLEPQSYGIPVVSFDIDGPNGIIQDGDTGYLAKDENHFVDRLASLIRNVGRGKFDRETICNSIKQKFSKGTILAKLEKDIFSD